MSTQPSERYLSYNPTRRDAWTEHANFPHGSVRYRDKLIKKYGTHWANLHGAPILTVYRFDENGDIKPVPEEEWPTP